jgi:hypothetical protein
MTRADASPSNTLPAAPERCMAPAEIHLELELARGSDSALLRVVSTLHRRRCRVLHASFHGDGGACDQLSLHVQAPGPYAPRVEHWLRGLVDVRRAVTLPSD